MANLTHLFKVGQKVIYKVNDFDCKASYNGTVKEVHEDHIIVDVPEISDHCYFEEGFNLGCIYPTYNF